MDSIWTCLLLLSKWLYQYFVRFWCWAVFHGLDGRSLSHSPRRGHLGLFPLVITNTAAVNTHMQVHFFGINSQECSGWILWWLQVYRFKKFSNCFPEWRCHFTFPPASLVFMVQHRPSSQHLASSLRFPVSHSDRCAGISHRGWIFIFLVANDGEHHFVYLSASWVPLQWNVHSCLLLIY